MKRNTKLFTLLSAVVLLAAACKKNGTLHEQHLTANDIKEKYAPKVQTFTVDASGPVVLVGAKGTKINIPSGAFVDGSGNPYTGTVSLKLTEVLDKKDILFSNVLTESNGQPLVS